MKHEILNTCEWAAVSLSTCTLILGFYVWWPALSFWQVFGALWQLPCLGIFCLLFRAVNHLRATKMKSFLLPGAGLTTLLLIAITDMGYGYYVFLKWLVSPTLLYLAYKKYKGGHLASVFTLGILGGIYNPIFPSPLSKELWILINAFTILILTATQFRGSKSTASCLALLQIILILTAFLIFEDQSYFYWDSIFDPPREMCRQPLSNQFHDFQAGLVHVHR